MFEFWSVKNIAFEFIGYPMSYIELLGTIFALWSVWLISQGKILTWPTSIISVLFFLILFYQIRLYSDLLEQGYYLVISIYGWWQWSKTLPGKVFQVRYSPPQKIIFYVVFTLFFSLFLGTLISKIHLLLPIIFPEPASFPYLDSFKTAMSFTAMWLMTKKWTESWIYWIIVDVISIGLYYAKDVKFISLLYTIFLVMAINGLISWTKKGSQIQSYNGR